jgi:hypothetical protein
VQLAWEALRQGTESLNYQIHDLIKH